MAGPIHQIGINRVLIEEPTMDYAAMITGLIGLVENLIRDFESAGMDVTDETRAKAKELRESAKAAAHATP